MEIFIDAISLSKQFGSFTAVNEVSLRVTKGEVLGFIGPNGAGKTTTMQMITGCLQPNAGEVVICGQAMSANPIKAKSYIGYLPEGAPLYHDMTPRQFLKFCGKCRSMSNKTLKIRIDYVIDKLGLEYVIDNAIDTLSKGFKRRVGLAQAILHDPEILILDEPTDGLDPLQKQDVRNLITEMSSEKAIIISTHILDEVESICTKAAIIADGELLAEGTPEDLAFAGKGGGLEKYFIDLVLKSKSQKVA